MLPAACTVLYCTRTVVATVLYSTVAVLEFKLITVYMKGPKQKGIISLENLKIGLFSGRERKK